MGNGRESSTEEPSVLCRHSVTVAVVTKQCDLRDEKVETRLLTAPRGAQLRCSLLVCSDLTLPVVSRLTVARPAVLLAKRWYAGATFADSKKMHIQRSLRVVFRDLTSSEPKQW